MSSKQDSGTFRTILSLLFLCNYMYSVSVSQGGGSGGSIRAAGGKLGEMEAAREEEYFRKLVSLLHSVYISYSSFRKEKIHQIFFTM